MQATLFVSALFAVLATGCGSSSSAPESDLSSGQVGRNGPLSCSIQTNNGRYLTAVGGGGRVTDVLHTDATRVNAWEKFILEDSGDGSSPIRYGIKTMTGNYLTAVGGGGRITDVIHSNATQLQAWEKFQLHSLGGGVYGIQTITGNWLTAVGGGGRTSDVIHSDATQLLAWEKFRFFCVSM